MRTGVASTPPEVLEGREVALREKDFAPSAAAGEECRQGPSQATQVMGAPVTWFRWRCQQP